MCRKVEVWLGVDGGDAATLPCFCGFVFIVVVVLFFNPVWVALCNGLWKIWRWFGGADLL
jgi:hypothetical protein